MGLASSLKCMFQKLYKALLRHAVPIPIAIGTIGINTPSSARHAELVSAPPV